MIVGRRIWVNIGSRGNPQYYDCRVLSLNRFLPAGPVAVGEPAAYDGIREKPLVKLWTDPGGMRVLAVDEIRLKDPRGRKKEAVGSR